MAWVSLFMDADDVVQLIESSDDLLKLTDRELQEIGDRARHLIKRRTGRGYDYAGQRFEPYSDEYARFRELRGRNVGNVDLIFTGEMHAAMTSTADRGTARLYFTSVPESRKAKWHNEGKGHLPLRRWLDIKEDGSDGLTLAGMARDFMASRFG